MPLSLPQLLRDCRQRLDSLPRAIDSPAAIRARSLLDRDLLPRTIGNSPYLVAGIIGPANSGKSALFNYLAQATLSPSRAEGGLTKSLLGIAHSDLIATLEQAPELRRFPINQVSEGEAALEFPNSPDELALMNHPGMPNGLLLIDTPDFDSVIEDNRLAAESFLAVADLAVLVVTRHSYQNREVVHFLQRWLDCGRPWILLYNESQDAQQDHENVKKLILDIGAQPLACFFAEYSSPPFANPPSHLATSDQPATYQDLLANLGSEEGQQKIKSRALHAAITLLRDDLEGLAAELASRCGHVRELHAEAKKLMYGCAHRCAAAAIPLAPIVKQAMDVQGPLAIGNFTKLKCWLKRKFFKLSCALRPKLQAAAGTSGSVMHQQLKPAWNNLWEHLGHSLGRDAASPVRHDCDVHLAELLDSDLKVAKAGDALKQMAKSFSEQLGKDIPKQITLKISQRLLQQLACCDLSESNLIMTRGIDGGISAPQPEKEDPLLSNLARKIIKQDSFIEYLEAWTNWKGEQIAEQLVSSVFCRSEPEWQKILNREGECLAELRGLSGEIGASLAIWTNTEILNEEIPINNSHD